MPRILKQPQNRQNGLNRYQRMVKDGTWESHKKKMIEARIKSFQEKKQLAERVKELEEELQKRL